VILLDRSGSMSDMESEMEEAIGSYLYEVSSDNPYTATTLILFDDHYEVSWSRKYSDDVPRVRIKPRGRTALIDAFGHAMETVAARTGTGKVLFVVVTDGLENASTVYESSWIRRRSRHMEKAHGWKFIYLGANQDAFDVGTKTLGFTDTNIIWNYDPTTLDCVFTSVGTTTVNFLSDPNDN